MKRIIIQGNFIKIIETGDPVGRSYNLLELNSFPTDTGDGVLLTNINRENRLNAQRVHETLKFSECSSDGVNPFASLAALITFIENGRNGLVVAGKLIKATDSFTTAVGATAYAVGDVVNIAGVTTGAGALRSINVGCNSGYLTGLAIEMDNASPLITPVPLPTLRVRFFDLSVANLVVADNGVDEVLFSNNVRRLGHIDLPIMVAETGRLIALDETIRFPFANLTGGLLYYKIINTVGAPILGTAIVGRGVFVRTKVDQNT